MLLAWPPRAPRPTLHLCIFLIVSSQFSLNLRGEQLLVECPPTLGAVGCGPRLRGTPCGHFTGSSDAQTKTHTYPEVLTKSLPHPRDSFHEAMSHLAPSLWAPRGLILVFSATTSPLAQMPEGVVSSPYSPMDPGPAVGCVLLVNSVFSSVE